MIKGPETDNAGDKKISKGYRLKPETHEMIIRIKQVLREDTDNAINTACRKFLEGIKSNNNLTGRHLK